VSRCVSLVLLVLLGGCSVLPGGDGPPAAVVALPEAQRPAAPAIVADTVEGSELSLADLEGPVVLNFWASWCGPCVGEAPHLNAISEAYAGDGVNVVGVNAKDDLANARSFEDRNRLDFPSWFDPDQSIAAAFGGAAPTGLPTTLILDAEHRVAVRFLGGVTGASLTPYLDQVLAEGAR